MTTRAATSADPATVPGGAASDKHGPRLNGLLLALGGSIAFSGKAIIVKLAYRHGVDAITLVMYRMLFALPNTSAAPSNACGPTWVSSWPKTSSTPQ